MDLKSAMFFIGIPYISVLSGLLLVWQMNRYQMTGPEQVFGLIAVIVWPLSLVVIAGAMAYDQITRDLAARSK